MRLDGLLVLLLGTGCLAWHGHSEPPLAPVSLPAGYVPALVVAVREPHEGVDPHSLPRDFKWVPHTFGEELVAALRGTGLYREVHLELPGSPPPDIVLEARPRLVRPKHEVSDWADWADLFLFTLPIPVTMETPDHHFVRVGSDAPEFVSRWTFSSISGLWAPITSLLPGWHLQGDPFVIDVDDFEGHHDAFRAFILAHPDELLTRDQANAVRPAPF